MVGLQRRLTIADSIPYVSDEFGTILPGRANLLSTGVGSQLRDTGLAFALVGEQNARATLLILSDSILEFGHGFGQCLGWWERTGSDESTEGKGEQDEQWGCRSSL